MSRRLIFAFGIRVMAQPMLRLLGIILFGIEIGMGAGADGQPMPVQRVDDHQPRRHEEGKRSSEMRAIDRQRLAKSLELHGLPRRSIAPKAKVARSSRVGSAIPSGALPRR
ncbi:MAG TPA: hypothetical protein VH855_28680 [Acetobacteraceae bacterium]|jgi:hypothetical protein